MSPQDAQGRLDVQGCWGPQGFPYPFLPASPIYPALLPSTAGAT